MPSWKKVITSGSNASLNSLNVISGITGSLQGTASYANQALTASYALSSTSAASASYVLNAVSSSFATTASFVNTLDQNLTLIGNQTITGSLTVTNNLIVLGSSSLQYMSQSTLNIGTNLITVNTFNPSVRFGGLAVIDSGSSRV
jgi:ABC-type transport system involved in Fe-S cluster assembly fused permease/ATPase subunit